MNTIESLRQRVQDYLRDERYRNEQETNYWLMQWKMLALEFDGLFSKAVAKAKEPAMDEVSRVEAEMRERFRIGSALPSYGQMQDWLDRIEAALQQPASADVEREARELLGDVTGRVFDNDGDQQLVNAEDALTAIIAALRKPQQEAEPVARENQIVQQHLVTKYRDGRSEVVDLTYAAPQPRIDLTKLQRQRWTSRGWEPASDGVVVKYADLIALIAEQEGK